MDERSHHRKLDINEITRVLKPSKQEATRTAHSSADEVWIRNARNTLRLIDGKVKTITINHKTMFVKTISTNRHGETIWFIKPQNDFVPCGWFTRAWLENHVNNDD